MEAIQSLKGFGVEMQHHFKNYIDSFTAQKIATTLWKSYDKLFYGNGNKVILRDMVH